MAICLSKGVRFSTIVVVGFVVIAAPMAVHADDVFSVQPKFSETLQHDSNPLLITSGAKAVSGSISSPGFLLNADTPTTHADLDTRLDFNQFDQKKFSSNDAHVLFHSSNKGELLLFGLNGGFDYDTTRTSEVLASGINVAGIRHLGYNISPQASYMVSPLDKVGLTASVADSTYEDKTRYTNYRNYSLVPSLQHSFDPINAGVFQLVLGRYQTTHGPEITFNNIAPMIGWVTSWTDQMTATVNAGYERTDQNTAATAFSSSQSSTTYDYVFNADIGYRFANDVLHFTASRMPQPQSNGTEAVTMSFGLTEAHKVTPLLELDGSIYYQKSDYTGNALGSQKGYMNINPKILYHLTDESDLSLSYRYQNKELQGNSDTADSQTIMMIFSYSSNKLSINSGNSF